MILVKKIFAYTFFSIFAVFGLEAGSFLFKKPNKELEKAPVIYHRSYNISFFGLQNFHPFDTCKYGRVHKYLMEHLDLQPEQFYKPEIISEEDLLTVHTKRYLDSLRYPSNILKVAELAVPNSVFNFFVNLTPYFVWNRFLLQPMKYATGGTVLGVDVALENSCAINLSGGYHHAKADGGEGFCYFADIPLAVNKFHEKFPDAHVMIIDLDAHQGNGHEKMLKDNPLVHIFDIYNGDIYPQDHAAKDGIEFDFPIPRGTDDDAYLSLLKEELPKAIKKVNPDFIIYNAGTDIFEEDPLGGLSISENGIIERDSFVFEQAGDTPILMLLSGGYTKKSAEIIGKSIVSLLGI